MPAGFYNGEIMFADNVRFDGDNQPGQVTANGQLLIGSTVAPNIRVGTITAGTGIDVTNGAGTITISNTAIGTVTDVTTSFSTAQFVNTAGSYNINFALSNLLMGSAGANITSGGLNAGYGFQALANLTSGVQNTAVGYNAGVSFTDGYTNTAIGGAALLSNTSGFKNVAVGQNCLILNTGSQNTAIGAQAMQNSGAGGDNVAVGFLAGSGITSGVGNVCLGSLCTLSITTGSFNVILGNTAGNACTAGSESGNILLNNVGVVSESNAIRIGNNSTTTAYIGGIANVTVANRNLVTINTATGQLGSMTSAGILWSAVTTNQTMTVNSGYIAISAGGALTFALPTTSSVGDIVEITLDGATSFQITQAVNQSIRFGSATTTVGITGSITSTAQGDTLRLVCSVANLKWNVLSSVGTLTIA